MGPKAIGARVYFYDTMVSAGMSDDYLSGTTLIRSIQREGKKSVHQVSYFSSVTIEGKEVEYLSDQSEVTIIDNKEIVSIIITEAEFTRNAQGKYNGVKHKTLCVDNI